MPGTTPLTTRIAACVVALLGLAVLSAAGAGVAQADTTGGIEANQTDSVPDTADGYLAAFRGMQGSPALSTYSEFEIIRSQAALEVQVGEFTAAKERRMALALRLLRRFEAAHAYGQNDSYARALATANESEQLAADLEEAGGRRYAVLASLAVDRFYQRTGESLLDRAERQERTPTRIGTLSRAATAFQRAGAVDRFSRLSLRVSNLTSVYERDMARVNESLAAVDSFADRCRQCGSPVGAIQAHTVGVFSLYERARATTTAGGRAVALAEKHGLTERLTAATERRETAGSIRGSLAVAGTVLQVGFAAVVGLVAAVVTHRLVAWRRDLEDAQAGDVVLVGEMLDA